tara:strand:+ start:746 stop:877 length:132 start_codon:yes stop_codon:yes gene_type:complete
MIKKITLVLLLCCMVISCGKKGDPQYKDPKKKAEMPNMIIKII